MVSKLEHPLKSKYFYIVYNYRWLVTEYLVTKCINKPPDEYMKELGNDKTGNTYSLIDYVEITKEEYRRWKYIKIINNRREEWGKEEEYE